MKILAAICITGGLFVIFLITPAMGGSAAYKDNIYNPGQLKPIDSQLMVQSLIDTVFCGRMACPNGP